MKSFHGFLFLSLFSSILSLPLDCLFAVNFDNFYTCTNLNLNVEKKVVDITSVNGDHLHGKNDENVLSVYFLSGAMRRLPRGIFKTFKNLQKYIVQGLDSVEEFLDNGALVKGDFNGAKSLESILIMTVELDQIRPRVFEGAENLIHLTLEACRIGNIDKDAFRGLKKLQSLGLKYNFITSLHPTTFSDLVELQHLLISGNYLKSITKKHFMSLKKILRISLIGNGLEEIDRDIVEGLSNLENIYLDQNICVNAHFGTDGIPFSKFQKSITNCTKDFLPEENDKNRLKEIKELEKEVSSLQLLVEKYKKGNCNQQVMITGGGEKLMLKRRQEMP